MSTLLVVHSQRKGGVGKWISADQFLALVATELPVLDGGRFRESVLERQGSPTDSDGRLSSALTLAVLVLKELDAIEIDEGTGDARKALLARDLGAVRSFAMDRKLATMSPQESGSDAFSKFLCWTPSGVTAVINPEAAAPSSAVLLATHQSVPLRRVDVPDAGEYAVLEQEVDESVVLNAVEERSAGALIIPVVGPSGSGKSHFVLWLRAKLDETSQPTRKVVYVPKGEVNLADVIDLILMDESGAEFDRLRASVREASASLSEERAAEELRNMMAISIQALPTDNDEVREAVIRGLPSLLYDADYATHLLARDGAFRRAARDPHSASAAKGIPTNPNRRLDFRREISHYRAVRRWKNWEKRLGSS